MRTRTFILRCTERGPTTVKRLIEEVRNLPAVKRDVIDLLDSLSTVKYVKSVGNILHCTPSRYEDSPPFRREKYLCCRSSSTCIVPEIIRRLLEAQIVDEKRTRLKIASKISRGCIS